MDTQAAIASWQPKRGNARRGELVSSVCGFRRTIPSTTSRSMDVPVHVRMLCKARCVLGLPTVYRLITRYDPLPHIRWDHHITRANNKFPLPT